MPRPNPPPTPGSSSDIRGKDAASVPPINFALPPTAYNEQDRTSNSSTTPSAAGSDSSYRPMSPGFVPESARKRSTTHDGPVITKHDFALPPPPTRSRKIIQMKPRESGVSQDDVASESNPATAQASQRPPNGASNGGRKKPANATTTAAGRKIARKTAHSLIERRRRSKMNEEFGVLKDLIPACKGQEMHKLAILQASIEYLRYLEQCVTDLQNKNNFSRPHPPPGASQSREPEDEEMEEDEENEDVANDDDEIEDDVSTPATRTLEQTASGLSLPSLSQITSTHSNSPSIFSNTAGRQYSISSASQASYSPYFHSTQTSPAFGPQLSHMSTAPHFSNAFGLGSPALKPVDSAHGLRLISDNSNYLSDRQRTSSHKAGRSDHELDQEATAALLMLNNDRRSWRPGTVQQEPASKRPRKDSLARSSHSHSHSPVERPATTVSTTTTISTPVSTPAASNAHRASNAGMSVRELLSG